MDGNKLKNLEEGIDENSSYDFFETFWNVGRDTSTWFYQYPSVRRKLENLNNVEFNALGLMAGSLLGVALFSLQYSEYVTVSKENPEILLLPVATNIASKIYESLREKYQLKKFLEGKNQDYLIEGCDQSSTQ